MASASVGSLAQGRTSEAEKLVAPIRASAAKSENARTRLRVAVAAARIRAAAGTQAALQAARRELETARDEVDRLGSVPERFEVNLALADVLQRVGERAVARKLLSNLVSEASAIGFGMYEKKAHGLLVH